MAPTASEATPPASTLRVLLVSTHPPGTPCGAALRRERIALGRLFRHELPAGAPPVTLDLLPPGATFRDLAERVRSEGGYHWVHWSSRGWYRPFTLADPAGSAGTPRQATAAALAARLRDRHGALPGLFVLSTGPDSGPRRVRTWTDLLASVGAPEAARGAPSTDPPPADPVAAALHRAGVAQVVQPDPAEDPVGQLRWLLRFYRALLGEANVSLAQALTAAASEPGGESHAESPVVHGDPTGRPLPPSLSSRTRTDSPRTVPPPHRRLAGRDPLFTTLAAHWAPPRGRHPVALVHGPAGSGRSAVAAEVADRWGCGFRDVFAWRGRTAEAFCRDLDAWLLEHRSDYRERCAADPRCRVHHAPQAGEPRAARWERIRGNLSARLAEEHLLVVIEDTGGAGGEDRGPGLPWAPLVHALAQDLADTGSRVLLTTSEPPLQGAGILPLPLEPLSVAGMAGWFRTEPALAALLRRPEHHPLARATVAHGRGHPLLLTLLTAAADEPERLHALLTALRDAGDGDPPDPFEAPAAWHRACRPLPPALLPRLTTAVLASLSDPARELLFRLSHARPPLTPHLVEAAWSEDPSEPESLGESWGPLEARWRWWHPGAAPSGSGSPPLPSGTLPALLAELSRTGLLSPRPAGEGVALFLHPLLAAQVQQPPETDDPKSGGMPATEVLARLGRAERERFDRLQREAAPERAVEPGVRSVAYRVQAGGVDPSGAFLRKLVAAPPDPAARRRAVTRLLGMTDELAAGRIRWRFRAELAEALLGTGFDAEAFSLFHLAAAEAEAAGAPADLGRIRHFQGAALRDAGRLDEARQSFLLAAEARERAGAHEAEILHSRMEARFLEVRRGGGEAPRTALRAHLQDLRRCWASLDAEARGPRSRGAVVGTILLTGMQMNLQVNLGHEQWTEALALLDEMEDLQRALRRHERERLLTRFSRQGVLVRLHRLAEAEAVVTECLEGFQRLGDRHHQARALSARAALDAMRDRPLEAVDHEREALRIHEAAAQSLHPPTCAVSHHNLAHYLHRAGLREEAARHLLAALLYPAVSGDQQSLELTLGLLAACLREGLQQDRPFALPAVAHLLAQSEFSPLAALAERVAVDRERLQGAIDGLVDRVAAQAGLL